MDHQCGKAEAILTMSSNSKIDVMTNKLKDIFDNPKVKESKIVVLSIVGIYRKGKSFLLNYCLRYLYAHVSFMTLLLIYDLFTISITSIF